ncbi:MAG: carbohydrate binding family 9 domain-containing protein, partial [Gemmatimonadetes bacterium]|nr:carbohydrate binding family 9 domain-containing protein [Gemmatimonadota bacterium]
MPTRSAILATALTALAWAPFQPSQAAAQGNAAQPAAARALRTTQAMRIPAGSSIHVDGKLDEAAWASAPATGDFTQSWPKPGDPATEKTEVRVLYDDDALYVGVRAFDQHPDSIASQLARRDATGIYSDWIHLIVDSYHDRRSGFRFSVNPRGVQKDVLHSNDTNEDLNWDAVWEVATSIDSAGWTAEYRIPFSQLRFGPVPRGTPRMWGLQVQREVARKSERDTWSPWTQNDGGYISREGELTGILDVPMPHRLEVMPYVSTRLTRSPPTGRTGDPFYSHDDVTISGGGDVKAGLPGGLTLTGTINPDFGQVEVDPAVVNLSAFETFFPEKRPFFVEGADIFGFGQVRVGASYGFQQFFYSRRIGAPPHGYVAQPYVDAPDQTTIVGAAKVSGKTGPWSVGVLEAVTSEERARFATAAGVRGRAAAEPWTNFFVGRVRRDIGSDGNTVVGAMVTSTNRALGDTVLSTLLRSRANLAGIDFEHLWHQRQWSVSGYAAGSSIGGERGVITSAQLSSARYYQRPDADYLALDPTRTTLAGYIAELALQRNGSLYGSLDLKTVSPGFEINDIGFQGRTDYRSATLSGGYNSVREGKHFRSWNVGGGYNTAWNFGGDQIWSSLFGNAGAGFKNFWSAGVYGEIDPSVMDDRLTRG